MSDTETHTVETPYGPAEIETYECDSCGNTVAYENTVEFTIGDRTGRACSHCESEGPVSVPKKAIEWSVKHFDTEDDAEIAALGSILLAPLFLPMSIVVVLTGEGSKWAKGYATAIVSLLVWVGGLTLLAVVL
jgi:hypothetical protein